MKVLNFGSINVDVVFRVSHIVRPAETIPSQGMEVHPGGKGANQSVALARAGATVLHAGQVGKDTSWMAERLCKEGVDIRHVLVSDSVNGGQAIIQVDDNGQNSIIIHGGANQTIPEAHIAKALADMDKGDWLVLQNEINLTPNLIDAAHQAGLNICLNPAPMTEAVHSFNLQAVNLFIVNEIEGAELARLPADSAPETVLAALAETYPQATICMTLGADGSCCWSATTGVIRQPAYPVKAVDTTAAGDTFTGFFLAELIGGKTLQQALDTASRAAAVTVSRHGAIDSIPYRNELPC